MIRYVDLSEDYWVEDQHPDGLRAPFAFLDTTTDLFFSFGGEQIWDSVQDFERAFGLEKNHADCHPLERFLSMIPDDVPKENAYEGVE
jgi:hypothetical protein